MTDRTDLAEWLLEQINRDEQSARALPHAIGDIQARWSPARLLAECDAKRRIVAECSYQPLYGERWLAKVTLMHLARPYADRSGYRAEWRLDSSALAREDDDTPSSPSQT